jgi:hypothetical protein
MADKSVSIDLIIKSSEAASSLKEVKQSLKDIKDAMISAGEGTPEFLKLARAAGELKDKVDDSNEAINAMNPNKFQAVATFASAAAGGVSAITGAMGLFGEQSEEVTKTLAKVQSAMALSQGLASLSELPKAWNNLKAAMASTEIVQKLVTIGTRLWNAALMANPIGLLIAGVVALTAGIYLLVKAFSSSNVEQERQLKLTKDLNAANVEGAKNAAVERNNLEILYKTSTDQTKSLQERKDAQVELQKTYPITFKNYTDEEFALGKAKIGFDNLTESVLALATMKAKQSVLDKMAMEKEEFIVTKTAELTQAISDQTNARTTWGKVAGYTREENIREEIAAKEKEFDLNSKAIIGEIEGAKTKSKLSEEEKIAAAQAAKDKTDAAAQAKSDAEKGAAAYKARKEEKEKLDKEEKENKAKIDEEYRLLNLTAEQKSFDDFYKAQKVFLDNKNITQKEFDQKLIDRQAGIDALRLEAGKKANADAAAQAIIDSQTEVSSVIRGVGADKIRHVVYANGDEADISLAEEGMAEQKAMRKKEFTDKLELALKLNEGLQSLSDMAFTIKMHNTKKGSAEEEKALRAQFKINKALQLSSVIIQGILAAQTAYAAGVAAGLATTAGVSSLPLGAIYAGVSIAGTLAAIAKISATQFDTTSLSGGGGGGGGGGGTDLNTGAATATSNSQPSTLLNPDGTVNNQNTPTPAPIQVYVVESDITSTQTQVAVVQNQMNFQ